jgi:serine/tyrosine/threonine adenylyltransferase
VYSSIDHRGRYAYDRQPSIGLWNLARLAEALLPLLGETQAAAIETARGALDRYAGRYQHSYGRGLVAKLGLVEPREGDLDLALDLLQRMADQRADFTRTFRALSEVRADDPSTDAPLRALFAEPESFDAWARSWRARLRSDARDDALRCREMRAVNPAFIARNHRVQQAIDAAVQSGDLGPFENLLEVLQTPYADHPERAEYARPPEPHEIVHQTFCGT